MAFAKALSPHLQAAWEEIEKCTSCGLCKDVCPVFALSRREAESPRGKVNLLRAVLAEEIDPGSEGVDIFNRCLLCYACQDACPAGVRAEKIWISGRQILADEVGRSPGKAIFLSRVLQSPGFFTAALRLGRRLPGDDDSISWRGRLLPRPAGNRLDRVLPEVLEPKTKPVGTVAFFPGCLLTEVFPQVGLKAAEILTYLGYRVITPRDRVCCGAPAFNNGDFDSGRRLAQRNLEIFSVMDTDCVISPDATCGGAFHHEYELLFPAGSAWRKTYLEVRDKVQDFGEFLLNMFERRKEIVFQPQDRRVAVHDSCHLSHLQHKSHVPRQLLSRIPGLKITQSSRDELCCGFGGSYSWLYPGQSRAIARYKLSHLLETPGRTIAVGSPGCLWRLRSAVAEMAVDVIVVHYLEIIRDALLGGSGSPGTQESPDSTQQSLFYDKED